MQNIASERVRMGLSQEELAHRLGVTRQAVGLWETEQTKPTQNKLIKLSNLFGCSTDYLLGLSEERLVRK